MSWSYNQLRDYNDNPEGIAVVCELKLDAYVVEVVVKFVEADVRAGKQVPCIINRGDM